MAKKNFHIPGYKGFLPGDKPENDHLGLTYTNLSRKSFTKARLDTLDNSFASTGYVIRRALSYEDRKLLNLGVLPPID